MILIEIDKSLQTYTIYDTTNNNQWEYDAVYKTHYTDANGLLHIEWQDGGHLELPAGCCVLNILDNNDEGWE